MTRLVLGPAARIQAPPNLIGEEYQLILSAGIDDWGGVSPLTPDHVNPERPWPQIDDLAAQTAAGGFELAERLTIYPPLHPRAVAGPAAWPVTSRRWLIRLPGSRAPGAQPRGLPWQEPDGGWGESSGRTDLFTTIDTAGRTTDRRDDFAEVYGDWDEVGSSDRPGRRGCRTAAAGRRRRGRRPRCWPRCAAPSVTRPGSPTTQALALLDADGPELDALAALADELRRRDSR